MLREEVINHWTGLKEKINSLRFSESDQQTANYLAKCPLISFIASTVKDDELDDWENKIKEIDEKIVSFDPENDTIIDWWFLATQYISTIRNWITLKKIYGQWRKDITELEDWKRISHFLLYKAGNVLSHAMLDMGLLVNIDKGLEQPSGHFEDPNHFSNNLEKVKEVRKQIQEIDFIAEVYQIEEAE